MRFALFAPLLLASAALYAQTDTPAPTAFEVISIKPNAAADNRVMIGMQPGGRFSATGIPLRLLLGQAFNIRDFQISGAPGWVTSERYDIKAKAPDGLGERIPQETMRPMLQNLLVERFGLKYHMDSKEAPIYSLVQAKGGSKMKQAEPGNQPMNMRMGRGSISMPRADMKTIAMHLSQLLGRKVVDNTGLEGFYVVELEFTPEAIRGGPGSGPGGPPPPPDAIPPSDNSGPSLFTALQEKLGLRLESTKGPVEVLVIDSISKPTEN